MKTFIICELQLNLSKTSLSCFALGAKTIPYLKLVRNRLETQNVVGKYKQLYFSTKTDLKNFWKKSFFLAKIVPLLKVIVRELC